ncbi:hypothetical protein GGX14DRAFT_563128 [Mycena pura]|uniref:Uncharacterized protein n=1 Tax=Mycena pura TaxID=153505 RepID=A0AAD6VNX3_9AGAR|nr:hypothetical protein GGX14DRAFT_563128 [Mycena pura]
MTMKERPTSGHSRLVSVRNSYGAHEQWFLTVSPADGSLALAGKSGWRGVEYYSAEALQSGSQYDEVQAAGWLNRETRQRLNTPRVTYVAQVSPCWRNERQRQSVADGFAVA